MQCVKIKGTTKITGLLGNPVKHSISPLIHNHAFSSLGLDFCYIPLGCEPDQLENLIRTLRALKFAGANVTIPYKSDVVPFCDELSELSRLTGTVNTLYMRENKLCGTTTDGEGFLAALREDNVDPRGKNIVILGNGGTSRTLAMILAHEKIPASLTLIGRNSSKVQPLADEVTEKTGFSVQTGTFDDCESAKLFSQADIVVNCTPVGMNRNEPLSPLKIEQMHPNGYYFDAIYNPAETPYLVQAKQIGARGQNGLRMLLLQGLASFQYWTGTTAPVELFNLNELLAAIEGK